ncbi:MAG: sugar transferase [Planctomycetes bacterium]|nr:sugar transferase [Planctomycetota bacterium]
MKRLKGGAGSTALISVPLDLGFILSVVGILTYGESESYATPSGFPMHEGLVFAVLLAVFWTAILVATDFTASIRGGAMLSELMKVTQLGLCAVLASGVISFAVFGTQVDAFRHLALAVGALGALGCSRMTLRASSALLRSRPDKRRSVVIVGNNERAQRLIDLMRQSLAGEYRLLGVVDASGRAGVSTEIPYLGDTDQLADVLRRHVVDLVFVTLPIRSHYDQIGRVISLCESVGIEVRLHGTLFNPKIARDSVDQLSRVPVVRYSSVRQDRWGAALKRLMDVCLAGVALVLLAPLFGVLALLIKLSSRGSVFFRQERCGLHGRRFTMLKFRSMVADAEAQLDKLRARNEVSGPVFKMWKDPRVTRLGRFLRKYSLDELPQLMNVMAGDMSLVGPRPPIPSEVERYTWDQRRRLSVRPGITGLWQVSGRSALGFDEWVRLDLEYIDHWSIGLDLRILCRTVRVVCLAEGAA